MTPDEAGAVLIGLHQIAVRLRDDAYRELPTGPMLAKVAQARALVERVLAGSTTPTAFHDEMFHLAVWEGILYVRAGAWLTSDAYASADVEALTTAFDAVLAAVEADLMDDRLLYSSLATIFDQIEFVPFVLVHDGPASLRRYLAGAARDSAAMHAAHSVYEARRPR